MKTSEQVNEISTALAKAQAEILPAELDGVNPYYKSKYATLKSNLAACRNALTKNGIAVIQAPQVHPGNINESTDKKGRFQIEGYVTLTLETRLTHSSGQWIENEMSVTVVNDVQQIGIAITYFRRYGLASMVGLVSDEDTDGNDFKRPEPTQQHDPGKWLPKFEEFKAKINEDFSRYGLDWAMAADMLKEKYNGSGYKSEYAQDWYNYLASQAARMKAEYEKDQTPA